ncbi:MAG: hypothetical protein ABI276_06645, partial [Acidimicrobiales bacterium]
MRHCRRNCHATARRHHDYDDGRWRHHIIVDVFDVLVDYFINVINDLVHDDDHNQAARSIWPVRSGSRAHDRSPSAKRWRAGGVRRQLSGAWPRAHRRRACGSGNADGRDGRRDRR